MNTPSALSAAVTAAVSGAATGPEPGAAAGPAFGPADDQAPERLAAAPVGLDSTLFMTQLSTDLMGALEDVIGDSDAAGFVSLVAHRIATWISAEYRQALGRPPGRGELGAMLVDLKRRIDGAFSLESDTGGQLVLTNTRCPFGDRVLGRNSLCMLTSDVFGRLSADRSGYAKVVLEETIARGHGRCRVIVHTAPGPQADAAAGREYFAPAEGGLPPAPRPPRGPAA